MTALLFQKVAVLLGFWLSGVGTHCSLHHSLLLQFILTATLSVRPTPCDLSIRPTDPVVPFGGSVTLNCSNSCVNETQPKWESSAQRDIQEGEGWTSVSFDNITDWGLQPVCFGDPAKDPFKMPVYLYQFSSPDIYLASDIVAGHQHTIVCNVSRLQVRGQTPRSINVSLSSGGQLRNSSRGSSSVEYTSVAQFDEDGMEVLCVANLQVAKALLEKATNDTLKVSARPHNVSVRSSVATYKAGADITVTCRAEGNPFPEFVWRLPSTDHVEFSDGNRTVTIWSAQSSHNGTYRCCVQNAYGSDSVDIDIVYAGTSRNQVITAVVVVLLLLMLVAAIIVCYKCRK